MGVLSQIRTAFQPPPQPAGNPAEFTELREAAYEVLFQGEPRRVLPHEIFEKPRCGGRINILIYDLPCEPEFGPVHVAVTSGMSDYRMVPSDGSAPYRREVIQYFRQCRPKDMARLHGVAWLPLASRFPLDFFQTVGPLQDEWPASMFLPPFVTEHAEFKLALNGDDMQLLWHVPLRQEELEYRLKVGVDALVARMQAANLPWIFDPENRPALF